MNSRNKGQIHSSRAKNPVLLVVCLWTLGVSISVAWNILQVRGESLRLATIQAQSSFEKDILYRRWAVRHGGVYVPVTEETQPNPNLAEVPERDVVTPSGRVLTLMNSAYMIRQVYQLAGREGGMPAHITSLNPKNPHNAPDSWEMSALRELDGARKEEIRSLEHVDGNEYLRLMRSLIVESQCLSCHAEQGYKEGDIRGAISISAPMEPFRSAERRNLLSLIGAHLFFWLTGIGGITYGLRRVRRSEDFLEEIINAIADPVFVKDSRHRFVLVNEALCGVTGVKREDLIARTDYEIFSKEEADVFWEKDEAVLQSGEENINEEVLTGASGISQSIVTKKNRYTDRSGNRYIVGVIRDITDRKENEDILRKSEEHFRVLVESAPDAIYIETGQCFAYVNEAAVRLYGAASREDLLGRSILDRIAPECLPSILECIRSLKGDGAAVPLIEHKHLKLNGEIVDVEVSVVPFPYENQNAALVFVRDISARKRAEDGLVESREQMVSMIESISDGFFSLDDDTVIRYINEAGCRLLGQKREDVIGRKLFDAFPEARGSLFEEKYTQAIREKLFLRFEIFFHREPYVNWYEVRVYPQRDGISVYFQVTTELKRAEEERIKLATAVEQASESIIITDRLGNIEYVNPAFEQVSRYSPTELLGKRLRILRNDYHDDAFYRQMWKTISSGNVWKGRLTNEIKDGASCELETTITPIRNGAGEIKGFVSINRDMTELTNLEQKLRQAQKLEAIGTLAGGIAHDFNNILSAIMGYTELAKLQLNKEDTPHGYLEQVMTSGCRARDLVKQILAFSRPKQGEESFAEVDVGSITSEVLKMMRASLPTTIEIRHMKRCQSSTVLADATQIHQVIVNLCTNAAHAMRRSGGILEIVLEEAEYISLERPVGCELTPGPLLRLSVIDTGHGMDGATVEKIFDPYFTTKAVGEGTGLGLAVVHGIVKRHGGTIAVRSEPGKGAAFHVYLSLVEASRRLESPVEAPLPRGSERVLLVDDEELIVTMGKAMLENLGYAVTTAPNGLAALDILAGNPEGFDVLLTDFTMPRMTGEDLAKEVLKLRPGIPILLCTGYNNQIEKNQAKASGITRFLMKPVSMRELAEAIREALDRG